jgi:aryl-alcohol dehydrogenase-like predicted oxidoreductase
VARVVNDLIAAGNGKYFGHLEVGLDTIQWVHPVQSMAALQSEYSLWWRDLEAETLPVFEELCIGLVPYSPLGRGSPIRKNRRELDVR